MFCNIQPLTLQNSSEDPTQKKMDTTLDDLQKDRLETLIFHCAPQTFDWVKDFCVSMRINQNLRHLSFDFSYFPLPWIEQIAEMMKTNRTLVTLEMVSMKINDTACAVLVSFLSVNETLTELDLYDNHIDTAIKDIALHLSNNHTLKILNLSDNKITKIHLLAKVLHTNTSLTHLRMSGNPIEDLKVMDDMIRVNYTMEFFDASLSYDQQRQFPREILTARLSYSFCQDQYLCNKYIKQASSKELMDVLQGGVCGRHVSRSYAPDPLKLVRAAVARAIQLDDDKVDQYIIDHYDAKDTQPLQDHLYHRCNACMVATKLGDREATLYNIFEVVPHIKESWDFFLLFLSVKDYLQSVQEYKDAVEAIWKEEAVLLRLQKEDVIDVHARDEQRKMVCATLTTFLAMSPVSTDQLRWMTESSTDQLGWMTDLSYGDFDQVGDVIQAAITKVHEWVEAVRCRTTMYFPRSVVREAQLSTRCYLGSVVAWFDKMPEPSFFEQRLACLSKWVAENPLDMIKEIEALRETKWDKEAEVEAQELLVRQLVKRGKSADMQGLAVLKTDLARTSKTLEALTSEICTVVFDHFPEHRKLLCDVIADQIESNGLLVDRSISMYSVDPEPLAVAGIGGARNTVVKARFGEDEDVVVLKHFLRAMVDKKAKQQLLREVGVLSRLVHPSIAEIRCVFFDHGDKSAYIEMPYYQGGTLRHWMQLGPDIVHVQRVIVAILEGIEFLHTHGVIHCDIKPENIFMGGAKGLFASPLIGDFDISRCTTIQTTIVASTIKGTMDYIAPEVLEGLLPTPKVDLYGLGVMAKELLHSLHGPQDPQALAFLEALCDKLTARDPSERCSASEALKHPFCRSAHVPDRQSLLHLRKEIQDNHHLASQERLRLEKEAERIKRDQALLLAAEQEAKRRGERISHQAEARKRAMEAEALEIEKAKRAMEREHQHLERSKEAKIKELERLQEQTSEIHARRDALKAKEETLVRQGALMTAPFHWQLKSLLSNPRVIDCTDEWRSRIQDLMMDSCKSHFIGQGRDNMGLTHKGYRVVKVSRIENPILWKRYVTQREAVVANLPAGSIKHARTNVESWKSWQKRELAQHTPSNEAFFFHGTKPEIVDCITISGFDERVCSLGGLFGAGIYLAENSSKSDEYCVPSRKGTCFMFLVRAVIGTPATVLQSMNNLRRPPCVKGHSELHGQFCKDARCDSVMAPTTSTHSGAFLQKYREFIVYDRAQCYPEFVIEFKRV